MTFVEDFRRHLEEAGRDRERRNAVRLVTGEKGDEPDKDWSAADAQALMRGLESLLDGTGWIVNVGGSVAKWGTGRDLDLMFLPTWLDAIDPYELAWMLADYWIVCGDSYWDVSHRYLQVVYHDRLGRFIDCAFWRTANEEGNVQTLAEARLEDAIADGWGDGC